MITKLKHFIRYNPIGKFLIFKPYLFYHYVIAVIKTKKRFKAYNEKYFSSYTKEKILDMYAPAESGNIWMMLEQNHKNIGDLAIGVADELYFKGKYPTYKVHCVYEYIYSSNKRLFKNLISKDDIIVLTGGGSIGNYQSHEYLREDIIKRFKDNVIVSMPQTMCFPEDKKGRRDYKKAVKIYNQHKKLYLLAREVPTYEAMKKAFPNNKIYLTPDIVMTLNKTEPKYERDGYVLCFRNDMEKTLSDDNRKFVEDICKKYCDKVEFTDMTADREFISLEDRASVVDSKINQLKHSKLVITDRLHCMIFCAISATPCIALSNYNWKVKGCYEWIKDLKYIKYCENIENIESLIIELKDMSTNEYDSSFTVPYFDKVFKDENIFSIK